MLDSKLFVSDKLQNTERKFGASLEYFPCAIILADGTVRPAFFTENMLKVAMETADKNIEDHGDLFDKSFLETVFGL